MRSNNFRRQGMVMSTILLAVMFVVLLMVQLPGRAMASEYVHIGGGHGEMSIAGIEVEVNNADTDEFSAAAVDVSFEGMASGDVSIAAVDAHVDATIGGDLSVAAVDVDVRAEIDGDLSLAGVDVSFTGSADDADIAGHTVFIDGTINGDLNVAAEEISFAPGSVITGNFHYEGPTEPTFGDEVTIGGAYSYEYLDIEEWSMVLPVVAIAGVAGMFALIVMLAFSALIGAGILLLLMTGLTARTIDGIRQRPISSIGMGVVVLIGLFVIAMLLMVTVIGIPLALAIFAFYPILILIGLTVSVLGVPYLVLRRDPRETGAFAKVGLFFLSVILLMILFAIPAIGQLVLSVILLMGIGAFGAAVLGGRVSGGTATAS